MTHALLKAIILEFARLPAMMRYFASNSISENGKREMLGKRSACSSVNAVQPPISFAAASDVILKLLATPDLFSASEECT